jgi:hypothetical protein
MIIMLARTTILCALALLAGVAQAQTDFYNTDRGRPLATEDAIVIERRAFELQAMPFTLERLGGGVTHWGLSPELAWGILPRTQVEVALPFATGEEGAAGVTTFGLAGVELEALHQLNLETMSLPAFALGAGLHVAAGPLAPRRTVATIRGLATRTLPWGRVHVNAAWSPGNALAATDPAAGEAQRWSAGVAADHTFALRSLLVGADLSAREALVDGAPVEWRAGVGFRKQVTPWVAIDAGAFRRFGAGTSSRSFGLTAGAAFAFAPPGMPGFNRPAPPRPATPPRLRTRDSYEQFYLPARHNFAFRETHPGADRLFNAFDYGHAILYEKLWTRPDDATRLLEEREFAFLTEQLLNHPPALPLVEEAIEPMYARLAPEAKAMFEWAHILHRQVYDVLADESLDDVAREREIDRVLAYYLSRPALAFSPLPKSMALMQERPYSLAFRKDYPRFNGLIWAYHWLQVGLYEPLVTGRTAEERATLVKATVARFRQMLPGAPEGFPVMMPMTGAIAPEFTRRYPTLAIIFDNLHSMHDVISDILANAEVPRDRKRALIMEAANAYRDDTTEVMTIAGWRRMTEMMGVHNQGGPAVGFPPELPKPTVPRGFVMRHDKDGNPIGAHDHH